MNTRRFMIENRKIYRYSCAQHRTDEATHKLAFSGRIVGIGGGKSTTNTKRFRKPQLAIDLLL